MSTCKIHLKGPYARFHDGPVTIIANTVAEAIEGMSRQVQGFAHSPIRHRIAVVGHATIESLHRFIETDEFEIVIVPQFIGGKNGAIGQVLIGAVLVAAAIMTGGTSLIVSTMMKVGAIMVLGGLSQLLAPAPEMDTAEGETQKSRYLGSPGHTSEIGTRIPILYGRWKHKGHYLSVDVGAKQQRAAS